MVEDRFVLELKRDFFAHLLNECRKNAEFVDVQLQIADQLFDAHRVILSLYSPVLKAAISDQWSTTKVCPLSDQYVDVEIVEDLLSFLYTGRIELTPDNIQQICVAAHFLQISTLLEPSVGYLCKLITTENVLSLFGFSISFELRELRKGCLQVVRNNYPKVFAGSQILELSSENFEDFIVGLKEQTCGSVQREHTFGCIIRWTEKNLPERSECLPKLLENIPLEELPSKFLAETVSTHPLVKATPSCVPVVLKAVSKHHDYPRKTTQSLVYFSDRCDLQPEEWEIEMISYELPTQAWKKLPRMIHSRREFTMTVNNQRDIIVCGGVDSRQNSENFHDSIEMFEWSTQTWTELPKAPVLVRYPGIATLNGCLYLAGGPTKSEVYGGGNQVLCYSFEKKQWKFVKSMSFERRGCLLFAYKDHLYAIGGKTATVERYDPVKDKWTKMAEVDDLANSCIEATLHNDKIYVLCGKNLDVFDPETNVYSTLAENLDDDGLSIVSINGKLLVVGGCCGDVPIHEFDLVTRQWIEISRIDPDIAMFWGAVATNW